MTKIDFKADWKKLLDDLLEGEAFADPTFRTFHRFSWRNRLLAMGQMHRQGKKVQPFGTYRFWQLQGRQVKKGEKASLILCQPSRYPVEEGGEVVGFKKFFTWKKQWFTMDQTDGEDFEEMNEDINQKFDLEYLGIQLEEFQHDNGNVHGYARLRDGKKTIAISPLVPEWKRRIITSHELAHCILHISEKTVQMDDNEMLGTDIKEVEAETAAFLVESALAHTTDGMAFKFSRDYVRHWLKTSEFTEKMAERIIEAATKILDSTRDHEKLKQGMNR